MKIRDFRHKGLERLYQEAAARGVPPDTVDKLRKMLACLDNMEDPEELRALTVAVRCNAFTAQNRARQQAGGNSSRDFWDTTLGQRRMNQCP
jgi:plasmid maintenance system killer protein